MSTLAIIPAAGSGTRMGSGTPKQFLALEGVPIFIHTLRKFIASSAVDDVFLALRPEEMARAQAEIDRENFERPPRLTPGGSSRQETVARALRQAPRGTQIVIVHDAVRPFVEPEMIQRIVDAARKEGAAIFAIPTVDTVKQVEHQVIMGTMPRERIALAQTPQAFRYDLIHEAFEKAAAEGFHGTDESSLIEHLGSKVAVLMGSDRNIKITKPSDLPLARLYIVQERERLRQPDPIGTPDRA
ncbi:MAG: 2-C-methyl-D-erythritol 4-phosphate cytidylyltransferase [Terriglobia bacterium]